MGSNADFSLDYKSLGDGKEAESLHGRIWKMLKDAGMEEYEVWGRSAWTWGGWDSFEEDMRALSQEYPNILFTLHTAADSDEPWRWRQYYLGGKMQHEDAVITYGEFDPAKLE